MPAGSTVILSNGGMRSVVATALAVQEHTAKKCVLLQVRDGRATTALRGRYTHQQAEHFDIRRVVELELPIKCDARDAANALAPMLHAQVLTTAFAQAIQLQADRLIWPVQLNGDAGCVGKAMELLVLVQQLSELSESQAPYVATPLLELTDQQLIELGGHNDVPWELAWSCQFAGETACRACEACRRRQKAFDAAGVVDPVEQAAHR